MGEQGAETNQLHVISLAAEKRSRRVLRLDLRVVPKPRLILHRLSLDRVARWHIGFLVWRAVHYESHEQDPHPSRPVR
jgi:hypothetical protein